jgi:hypothetical protein
MNRGSVRMPQSDIAAGGGCRVLPVLAGCVAVACLLELTFGKMLKSNGGWMNSEALVDSHTVVGIAESSRSCWPGRIDLMELEIDRLKTELAAVKEMPCEPAGALPTAGHELLSALPPPTPTTVSVLRAGTMSLEPPAQPAIATAAAATDVAAPSIVLAAAAASSNALSSSPDCSLLSLAGRRFLRVGFIDEQLGSAKKGLEEIIAFAKGTNRTLVEMFAGGSPATTQFHMKCQAPTSVCAPPPPPPPPAAARCMCCLGSSCRTPPIRPPRHPLRDNPAAPI